MRVLIKVKSCNIDIYINLDKITYIENIADDVYNVFYFENDKFTFIGINEMEFKKITKFFEVV